MVKTRRLIPKEDASSLQVDSGISLSSHATDPSSLANEQEEADHDAISSTEAIQKPAQQAESLSPSSAQSSPSKRVRKPHVCNVCQKEFTGNTDLKRHLLIHNNERPHKCEMCNKCFRQAVNLKNHMVSAHGDRKQFHCALCPRAFALKDRLRLHFRLHSGEKPYACPYCDNAYARGGQLNQHIIAHHKEMSKQYKCTVCSASFSSTTNLRAHMERHEDGPDQYCEICDEHFANNVVLRAHKNKMHFKLRQFDCEICQKAIKDGDLAAHMKQHANVKMHICEVCNSCFLQKSQYNVHMRMHTGERPYQCKICLQSFAHSSVLKLHIRKHTGEKPFSCVICEDEVTFAQLAHLKTHMKKIHQQENSYMCEGCNCFFKLKIELQAHMEDCSDCNRKPPHSIEEESAKEAEMQTLSHLRFMVCVLLKRISSEQRLRQLGYEKRLIDNVVIASLKLAQRPTHEDAELSAILRLRLNIEELLDWTVPAKVMKKFREEQLSIDDILDNIVTMYMKQK